MTRKASNAEPRVIRSSGNIFADLGAPNPQEALAKAELARQIARIVQREGLSQAQIAHRLGIDQPKVSALSRGRLRDFSIERLMRFIVRLGHNVEIGVAARKSASAGLQVSRV